MTTNTITAASIDLEFVPNAKETVAAVELDGEVVLYEEEFGGAHVLSPTASVVWSCCDGTANVATIAAEIAEAYGADAETVRNDVIRLVQEFGGLGLLDGVERDETSEHHHHDD